MAGLKILVTGANGFIGTQLVKHLNENECGVLGISRTAAQNDSGHHLPLDLTNPEGWRSALADCDVVVHLGAVAHSRDRDNMNELQRVNVAGSLMLAGESVRSGVKRFIFLSSTGVNGPQFTDGKSYCPDDLPQPHDLYSKSKAEAEIALAQVFQGSGCEFKIVRAPMVYGPNAPGTFGMLLKMAKMGVPLPLKGVENRRDFISVDNLASLLCEVALRGGGRDTVYLVSDNNAMSTAQLYDIAAQIAGVRGRKFSLFLPTFVLRVLLSFTSESSKLRVLWSDFSLDISRTLSDFRWVPAKSNTQVTATNERKR